LKDFERAFKKGNFREKINLFARTEAEFFEFLHALPFKEKKRIVEAVI
jgi:hypothetical protein